MPSLQREVRRRFSLHLTEPNADSILSLFLQVNTPQPSGSQHDLGDLSLRLPSMEFPFRDGIPLTAIPFETDGGFVVGGRDESCQSF